MKKIQIFEGPSFPEQTVSIDFDGVDEVMRNTTDNPIGIANVWSIGVWAKTDTIDLEKVLLNIRAVGSSNNGVLLDFSGDDPASQLPGTNSLVVRLKDSGNTTFKQQSWGSAFTATGVWRLILVTWDGTDLTVYYDGVDQGAADASPINNAGTMTDTSRSVYISSTNSGFGDWDGRMHSIAVWDVDVGAAASTIYNAGNGKGFDLGTDTGSYTFSGDLQHWWRLGFDSGDLGKDSGIASTLIDVDANSVNITAADIVTDSPGA